MRARNSHFPLSFLRKRADFLALRNGRRADAPAFLLVAKRRAGGGDYIRVGLTVTKKLGSAVRRNRIRRRLREAARIVLPLEAEAGCDYMIVARAVASTQPWPDLLDDLKRALLSLRSPPA